MRFLLWLVSLVRDYGCLDVGCGAVMPIILSCLYGESVQDAALALC